MHQAFDPFDPDNHAGRLPSPCISHCVMNAASGLCEGCQRTIEEIVAWGSASEAQRRGIWHAILLRRRSAGGES